MAERSKYIGPGDEIQISHQSQLNWLLFTRDVCCTSAVANLAMHVEICLSVFVYPELRYGKPKRPFLYHFSQAFVKKNPVWCKYMFMFL